MKHEPLTTTLSDCINRVDVRSDSPWYDVMGVNIPGLREAIAADELDTADAIEAEYITRHGSDQITVVWPEHVLTPRFNSDASYQ